MIYRRLVVTDQSYEVSCYDIFFLSLRKSASDHAVVCDAFIFFFAMKEIS